MRIVVRTSQNEFCGDVYHLTAPLTVREMREMEKLIEEGWTLTILQGDIPGARNGDDS